MKLSEARIIIYLKTAEVNLRYVQKISAKLDIDYGYILKVLATMLDKSWIVQIKYPVKTFYRLTDTCPIDEAMKKIEKGGE